MEPTIGPKIHRDLVEENNVETLQGSELIHSDDLARCLAGVIDGTAMSLDLVPMALTMRDPLLHRFSRPLEGSQKVIEPTYRAFPITTKPVQRWDIALQRIIDEPRTQHATGLYPTQTPSLRSILSNKSSDVLALRLYHLICLHGPMTMHIFLAIFWV